MRANAALIGSLAVVLIVGGGIGAYLAFSGQPAPKIATFIGQPKPVLQDGDALAKPQAGAEVVARLSQGMTVDVGGIVEGGKYAQVTLPDRRVAYFPASGLIAPPAPPSSPPPPPAPAEAAPPPQPTVDDGPPVEFDEVSEVYTIDKPVIVYVEPNIRAPQRYQIDAKTSVPVVGRSKDGVWVRASTEDGQPAFLLVSDLGEPVHGKAITMPSDSAETDQPDTVDGVAKVITTADLDIGGQKVTLSSIVGDSGSGYVQQLQTIIDSQGGNLHCVRQTSGYQCKLPTGIDIALSALFNGGARATDDAPVAYKNQAKSAQTAGRGLWHQ